jgi:hypothetical protein
LVQSCARASGTSDTGDARTRYLPSSPIYLNVRKYILYVASEKRLAKFDIYRRCAISAAVIQQRIHTRNILKMPGLKSSVLDNTASPVLSCPIHPVVLQRETHSRSCSRPGGRRSRWLGWTRIRCHRRTSESRDGLNKAQKRYRLLNYECLPLSGFRYPPNVDLRPLTVESPTSQEVEAGTNPLMPDLSEEDCWTRPFAGLSSPYPA